MTQVFDFSLKNLHFNGSNPKFFSLNSLKISHCKLGFPPRKRRIALKKTKCRTVPPVSCKVLDQAERSIEQKDADGGNFIAFPHVQTLRTFLKEELYGKVVLVRFDSVILLRRKREQQSSQVNSFSSIKYLHEAGAKVILVSSWNENANPRTCSEAHFSLESVADFLSSMLELEVVPVKFATGYLHSTAGASKQSDVLLLENLLHFKGEVANCSKFAKQLASGVDIVINDAFSQSHKALASTVGVACFCYAYVAGFYFEEGLDKLKKIIEMTERPYMAIIGGGNLSDKAAALRVLTRTCDGLVFVGTMAFQIMHALGLPVPMKLVEHGALKEAAKIVELARSRNIPLVLPKDILCVRDDNPEHMKVFSVGSIPEGWQPVDIGPRSLEEMTYILSNCKKIMWIGPMKFISSRQYKGGVFKLTEVLDTLNRSSCSITFVGRMEFEELLGKSKSFTDENFFINPAVVWEVLKGRKLPGLMALDRAYPFQVDWDVAYADQLRPLVVDVGSGNGMFLFGMARRRKDMNFLGLEMNTKLVDRCLDDIHQFGCDNVHFIATNATSSFRSIVSSYPGELVLVSIQCPNPDFNKPEYRWRMLQRSLIEAIADMLVFGGEVFLQSDVEGVALRMKREFIEYGKGKLVVMHHSEDEFGWLEKNPFGVPSDWERHVLDRGDTMYRLLLTKVEK